MSSPVLIDVVFIFSENNIVFAAHSDWGGGQWRQLFVPDGRELSWAYYTIEHMFLSKLS